MGEWHQQNGGRGLSSAFTEHIVEINFLRYMIYKNSILRVNYHKVIILQNYRQRIGSIEVEQEKSKRNYIGPEKKPLS